MEVSEHPPERIAFQLKAGNKITNTIYGLADILQQVEPRLQPKNTIILDQKKCTTF